MADILWLWFCGVSLIQTSKYQNISDQLLSFAAVSVFSCGIMWICFPDEIVQSMISQSSWTRDSGVSGSQLKAQSRFSRARNHNILFVSDISQVSILGLDIESIQSLSSTILSFSSRKGLSLFWILLQRYWFHQVGSQSNLNSHINI